MKRAIIVLFLWLLAACAFAGNGPAPIIDTDSVSGLGTMSTQAADNVAITGGVASLTTLNGVAPMTAAEKTQALVGLNTIDFAAKSITASAASIIQGGVTAKGAAGLGAQSVKAYYNSIANGGATATVVAAPTFTAVIMINVNGSATANAKLWLSGTVLTVEQNAMAAIFSNTKDTAGHVNMYVEGGNLVLQNNWTGAAGCRTTVLALEP